MISLTIPSIRAWALALPADLPSGRRLSPCNCPLAEYIRDNGGTYVAVLDTISWMENGTEVTVPRTHELNLLICGIDSCLPRDERNVYPITLVQVIDRVAAAIGREE